MPHADPLTAMTNPAGSPTKGTLPASPPVAARTHTWLGAGLVSVTLHVAMVVVFSSLAMYVRPPAHVTIELDVMPTAPIEIAPPLPTLPPPPEPLAPVPVARLGPSRPPSLSRSAPRRPLPESPRPQPEGQAPRPPEPGPVAGIAPEPVPDSVTEEDVALPIGDTLLDAPSQGNSPARAAEPSATGGESTLTGEHHNGQPGGDTRFSPVGPGQIRQMPSILKEIQVAYPERARMLEIEGTVLLSVGVDENGRTREVRVLRGIGYGLDEAAMQALRDFRWRPAIGHDGRPVPVRLTYSYRFRVPR